MNDSMAEGSTPQEMYEDATQQLQVTRQYVLVRPYVFILCTELNLIGKLIRTVVLPASLKSSRSMVMPRSVALCALAT